MHAILSQVKRPLLAVAMLAVLCSGIASAANYYYVYETSTPVYSGTAVDYVQPASAPCGPICQPAAPIAYTPALPEPPACSPCGANYASASAPQSKTFGLGRTDLPGWYSDDYDYNVSSQRDLGITYLVPTSAGMVETNRIPLTNPVDQYYATHEEIGGKVVDLTNPANRALEDQNTRAYVGDPANRVANPSAALQRGLSTQTPNYGVNQPATQAVQQPSAQMNTMNSQINQTASQLNQLGNQMTNQANQVNSQVGGLTPPTPSQTTVDSVFPNQTINY